MTERHVDLFVTWALNTFEKSTVFSSLKKLDKEIKELKVELNVDSTKDKVAEEYVDCIMCLIDSAARYGITPQELRVAFSMKLFKNAHRTWIKNDDNTYSHVKQQTETI